MTNINQGAVIASNLKKLLKERKLTQKDLAEQIGISQSTMSDYMNFRSKPSHGVIQRMADALNVEKSDIDTTYKTNSKNDIFQIYNDLSPSRKKIVDEVIIFQHSEEQKENSLLDDLNANDPLVSYITLFKELDDTGKNLAIRTLKNYHEVFLENKESNS